MNLPLLLITSLIFVGVLAAILFLERRTQTSRPAAVLAEYAKLASTPDVPFASLTGRRQGQSSRVERLLSYAAITAPRRLRASTATDLAKARARISPNVFLGIRGVLLVGIPVPFGIWVLSLPQKSFFQWGMLAIVVVLAPRMPGMWLKRRIKANQRSIERALPYALDLMVACLEGGLSLEATLDKVAGDNDTLLSEEIRRTLAEITLGRPSTEALRELGDRTGAPDLKRLTETVVQAERMGVSIAEAMRTLAEESRDRRRQHAEEAARKAPIKMLPVLVVTTLPAVGAIVMTPAILNLTHAVSLFTHR
jgi:tight adherence protein C